MAVDKKSDYVGIHGGGYTDMDGNSKQFTYVDHDIKTKIYVPSGPNRDVEVKKVEKTELEILSEQIVHSGMNGIKEFMEGYDELGKRYSFERFNRRAPVTFPQLNDVNKGPKYVKDLKELYEHICKTSEEGQGGDDS